MEHTFAPTIEIIKRRVELLNNLKLVWEEPIKIPINDLVIDRAEAPKHIWEHLTKFRKAPAVYFFNISHSGKNQFIRDEFKKIKGQVINGKIRNTSNLDEKRSLDTTTLYVGSVKSNLHGRLAQHLGFSNHKTGALHLACWANSISEISFEFKYSILDYKYQEITEWIEYSIAETMNPLIGRKHKI